MSKKDILEKMIIRPKNLEIGSFLYTKNNTYKAGFNFDDNGKFDYLLKLCGYQKGLNISGFGTEGLMSIVIGDISSASNAAILVPEYEGKEAYSIEVGKSFIIINSYTQKGIACGLKTLARLLNELDELPVMKIQDFPSITCRAVHLCIFYPNDGTHKEDTSPESIKKMLLCAAMSGYNYALLEFWGMFPYRKRSYACHSDSVFTREVVNDIISYAIDNLHITPLPCQNLTSHAGWSRIGSRKHVVLDQRPDLGDMWIPGGWCFATENQDTKEYLKDIMDDLLETFRNPPYFHVCCDKCFGFGSTEEDRTKPADILFVNHLSFLNNYLQARKTQMIMWADMLYSSTDSLYWKCNPDVVNYLPRNIIMNIWTHNNPGVRWYDVDFFQDKGFETVYSPFLDKDGAKSMIDICRQKNSLGIVQTTWHKPQTALSTVVYSGALQWNNDVGIDVCMDERINNFVSKWYKMLK